MRWYWLGYILKRKLKADLWYLGLLLYWVFTLARALFLSAVVGQVSFHSSSLRIQSSTTRSMLRFGRHHSSIRWYHLCGLDTLLESARVDVRRNPKESPTIEALCKHLRQIGLDATVWSRNIKRLVPEQNIRAFVLYANNLLYICAC